MRAEGKFVGERQTCFTCSDLNQIKYSGLKVVWQSMCNPIPDNVDFILFLLGFHVLAWQAQIRQPNFNLA